MIVTNLFSTLPAEVLSIHILLRLPFDDLRITSLVNKFFNEFFYEGLPWKELFDQHEHQLVYAFWKPLQNAYEHDYIRFITTCFRFTHFLYPRNSTLIEQTVEANKIALFKAFIESGRYNPCDSHWSDGLILAFINCQENFLTIFINNPWEIRNKAYGISADEIKRTSVLHVQKAGLFCLNVITNKKSLDLLEQFGCIPKEPSPARDKFLIKAAELDHSAIVRNNLTRSSPAAISVACEKAAALGHDSIVILFITHDKNLFDKIWLAAVENNRLSTVQLIVSQNFKIPEQALIAAAEKGHVEIVEYLITLNKDAETLNLALKGAARANRLPIIKFFITKGLCEKPAYDLACQEAVIEGHVEVVRIFLEANFCEKTNALKLAAKNSRLEIIQLLNPAIFDQTLLQEALKISIQHNHPKIVAAFIEQKWVLTVPIDFIIIPIQKGFHEVVDLLFSSPFFKTLTELDYYSMLNNAVTFSQLAVVQILIKHPNFKPHEFQELIKQSKTHIDWSPLVIQAAQEGKLERVQVFAHPTICTPGGLTAALHKAAENHHLPVVEHLMTHYIPPGMSLSDFYSLLLHATAFNQLALIQILFKNDFFEHIAPSSLQKIFDLAKAAPDPQIAKAFLGSRRRHELSKYLLVRLMGLVFLLSRRLFAWLTSLFTKR